MSWFIINIRVLSTIIVAGGFYFQDCHSSPRNLTVGEAVPEPQLDSKQLYIRAEKSVSPGIK